MLTAEEKQERECLRGIWAPLPGGTLHRLIELERKDAARMCPVCEIEHNTEQALNDGTLPALDLTDFDDEPTKERKR